MVFSMGQAYAFFLLAYAHPSHSLFLPLELVYSVVNRIYVNAELAQIIDPNN